MEKEGDPSFPALSCDSRACGGSCTECVSPRPGLPVEDRGSSSDSHTEASLELQEGVQAFLFLLLVSRITWEAGLGCCPPSSPSQLGDVEGVAGGQVGRDLRLEPVDVAAVAEQVAFQWITAVTLFVV